MRTVNCFLLSIMSIALLGTVSQSLAVPVTNGGPGGFEPVGGSSDLTLWLKGDAGLSTAGSAVTAWADQSGYGNDVTQGDVNKQPTQTVMQNSIPLISFDGGGVTDPANFADFMTTAGSVTAQSIFIMNTTNGFNSAANPIISNNGTLSIRYLGAAWRHPGDGNDFTFPASSDFRVDGASATAAAQGVAHVLNGARSSAFTFNTFRLAQHNGLHNRSWEGDMGEVVVFNRALNSVETVLVDNYLNSKFNIALDTGGGALDRYDGDTVYDYDSDVFGIGNDGSSSVILAGTAGMGLEATGGTLDNGEFILAGHSVQDQDNGLTTSGPFSRWERNWYVDTNGGSIASQIAFDWSDAGIGTSFDATFQSLLYSPTSSLIFSEIATASGGTGDQVLFDLPDGGLMPGFYTLGTLTPVPEPSSLLLLGLGVLGLTRHTRRRCRRA